MTQRQRAVVYRARREEAGEGGGDGGATRSKSGVNRLCSAFFEQLIAFSATFCTACSLEQLLPSLATFESNS